mgnify:FL=1
MRKKQEKKVYSAPRCMIIQVSETTYLMDTSFPSQHKKATHASGPSASAKSFGLWSDEHFEEGSNDSSSSWDD